MYKWKRKTKAHRQPQPPPATWLLYGSYFRLPIEVFWQDWSLEAARVKFHSGLRWLDLWKEAMRPILFGACDSELAEEEGWCFSRAGLQKVAVPVPPPRDANAEKLVRWSPEDEIFRLAMVEDASGLARADVSRRVEQFLRAFVDAVGLGGFETIDDLTVFYHLLCNFMLRWLQTRTDPVDLVFCRLFPSPLKTGWVELAPRGADLTFLSATRKGLMLAVDAPPAGVPRKPIQFWRVEVLMNQRWRDSSRQHELHTLEVLGQFGYIKANRERAQKIWPLLQRKLADYRKENSAASMAQHRTLFRDVEITPMSGRVIRKRPGFHPTQEQRTALERFNRERAQRVALRERALAGSPEALPEMPDLQPEAADVRDGG